MGLSWNFVFIISYLFTRACAISPEITLTSAITSSAASSTCELETFTITSPYGITGPDQNCSMDHDIDFLHDGNENTWWQSMTRDENVTLNFQFNDSFVLSGVGLAFRSPLPQLVQVQVRLNEALVTTLVYADDCQIYSGTCYPLGNIVDYEVNCSDTLSCPQLVNLNHTLPNVTANSITYMFINMDTELLNISEAQYYAIAEVTIYGYVPTNYYFSSLHSIVSEAEYGIIAGRNVRLPLLTAIPQFSGEGYTNIATNNELLPFRWSIEIPRSSAYRMILRHGNINDPIEAPLFTGLVMSLNRNGYTNTYRFFIESCGMAWCYSQAVGVMDTTTVASYPLEAGVWEISALMNVQSLILDVFIAIPEEFYNPVLLGPAAGRFTDECGMSTNTLGRGTTNEYFCFQSAFTLSYDFFPMLFECFCDPIGSVEQQLCDPIGGQCPCIQPVNGSTQPYGLNCSLCPSLTYGPTNTGCEECNCINDSQCNFSTGECPQCEPNTFGDPTAANGCTPCTCVEPGTALCNSTSGECVCEPFYAGATCDRCMMDAFNDTEAGCQPCQCSVTGSINQSCSSTGQCNCKPLVSEPKCTSCEPGAFYFNDSGCIECWCNGLTGIECDTFNGSYETVAVRFNSIEGWSLAVPNGDELLVTTTGIYLEASGDTGEATLSANISNINSSVPVYWNVPSSYVNMNWLFAYGGDLVVETIQYGIVNFVGNGTGSTYSMYGVYLTDNSTVLVHSVDPTMDISILTVALVEDSWLDTSTGRPVTRPVFMSVLANLSAILLPAAPANSGTTIIRLISFQYGNASAIGNDEMPIERCSCPVGHTGLSCQECMDGYFMSSSGVCISCQCNGYSTGCDPTTGECQNCQNNTMGFNCEQCLPCYIDIASGPSFICKPCNCSLTGCRNCSIDAFGEEQCACHTGYDGEQCNICDDGYFQSPLSGECILSCGECVDKLVMIHNESMQDVATLQNRLATLYDDLSFIYQQLNNVTLQAIPLMNITNISLDINQQLEDDLRMVDDCSMEVDNVTLQVNALWEEAMQLHDQINGIPNLTNNAAEAMSLYNAVSTFNMTIFVVLSQLELFSMQANTILLYLSDTVASYMDSYVNEINESLQLLQNVNGTLASAANVERIASAHQEKLNNITEQLQLLSDKLSILGTQVDQLDLEQLQQLGIDIQQLRLRTMSLFSNVSDNYTRATKGLQWAGQVFMTAVKLEQNITAQLEILSERLADQDGSGSSDNRGNQGGEVVQELSELQSAVQNSFAFLSAINNSQAADDARIQSNQLTINATTISSILWPALLLRPAEIVRNFSALLAAIEEAANNSAQANETITETLQQVMLLISEGLANRATQLYTYSRDLSSQVVTLNTSLETTQATVNRASEEANIFEELRNATKNSVQLALNQVSQLQIASSTVQSQVNSALNSAISSLHCVSISLYSQQCEVDEELYSRLTVTEDTILNSTSLLYQTNNSLTDTLAIINNQTGIIPVIQNQSITNNQLIEQLNVSVQALRRRMSTARMAVASIAVALRLSGNQTYSYSLPTSVYEDNNEHTQLSMIFRTVGPDGTLLYSSNSMDQCVSLGLVNRQVVFSFALNAMSVVVNNPLSIEDDIWYQIFATRDADIGRLSVTQLQGTTVTTYATGVGSTNASVIPLMDKVYVGGISSMTTGNCVTSEQFTGCVDTVVVNNEPLSLLLPDQGLDSVTPCGPRPPVEPTRPFDRSTWMLGGGSYVMLTAGQQLTNTFRVMMGFRTSNPHGVFYFSGKSVVIFLMDGQVWYQISGVISRCEVNTTQRYDDNTWHYLTALYSGRECSITVDDEVVTQSTPELTIPAQVDNNYIGGAPLFAGRGVPLVSFAGCLRDVIIGTVRKNLSDNLGSERINFNGCPVNVTSGVRFNGEGYAQLRIARELVNDSLTNIMFSFKTTQVTGLLLQLGRENELILSLYHTHVRLEYYYNTSSAVLESSSAGYNDNLWHTVSVTLTNDTITMMVDSMIAATQERLPTITLPDQLTIGGSSTNNFLSNIAIRYRGCFHDLIINNRSHDFHNPMVLVGVSLFGCYLPADLPPTPTSTVVTMASTTTVPSMSSDIAVMTSTRSVSIPLSITADVVTTEQPISLTTTFSPETLSTPSPTSFSITVTSTPVVISTVVLPTPTSVVSATPIPETSTSVISTPVVSGTLTPVISETPTTVVSETPTAVISETPTTVVSETPTAVFSETPTAVISETSTAVVSETPTAVISETPTTVVSETPTAVISETPTAVISEISTAVVSETPTTVVSETPTTVISETPTAVISETSTAVVSETPTAVISETPTTVVSETPTAVISETPTAVISETPTTVSETPTAVISETSTAVVSETPTAVISETPTAVISETPTTVVSETPTAVISETSTAVVSETPTAVISETPTAVISETPTTVVSETPTAVISETPTAVISETSTAVVSETPTAVVSDTPTAVVSETQTTVVSDTPTAVISETPTAVVSETPTTVVSDTPTAVISETPTAVVSETPTTVVSDTPTAVVSETPTAVVSDTPTAVISETPTAVVSETSTAVVSETPTAVVSDTPTAVISETPTAVISETSTTVVSETPTAVVSETSTETLISSSTSIVSTPDTTAFTSRTSVVSIVTSTTISSVISTPVETTTSTSISTPLSSEVIMTTTSVISSVVPITTTILSTIVTPSVAFTSSSSLFVSATDSTSILSTDISSSAEPLTSTPASDITSSTVAPMATTSTTIISTPVETPTTLDTVTGTEISMSSSPETPFTTTSIMLTSSVEETVTSTPVSSIASSTVDSETTVTATIITTTSVEVSTPSATTIATITPTTSSSSEATTPTVTLPPTSVLTTSSILPTPTPLPPTLGLNGLGSFISLPPRTDLTSSYNIQIVFQTRSIEGILLYTESVENGDFLALYLRNGLVTYSFDLGGGTITVESSEQYSDGLLHNVTIDRTGHISLVIINDGAEVVRAVGRSTFTQLNLGIDNFYVGGVSPMVVPSKILEPGEQSFPSVEACINSLHINNEEVNFNLNSDNSGIVDCSEVLINEVVTFTGNNSYAQLLESLSPITDFQLTLSFRSSIENRVDCNGLLVYIGSSDYFDHLTLNLDGGRLLLTFNNGGGTTAVEYDRADVNFCDGNWYEVEVMKSGINAHLILNGTDSEMSSSAFSMFTSIDSTEPLFIGGISNAIAAAHNVTFIPFRGCIRNLMLYHNGQIVPAFISRSVDLANVNLAACSL